MDRLLQLMHAEGCRNGNRYEWANYFEPSRELTDPFDRAAEHELKWEDFDL